MKIQIGKYNHLQIIDANEHGFILGFTEDERVLLPNRYLDKTLEQGDWLDVFVYLDSEDRPIATTENPLAQVGQFKLLRCLDVNQVGAFLDWGLSKDLLAPYGQQAKPMHTGRSYLVYLYIDNASQRIVASSKLDRFVDKSPHHFSQGEQVDLIVRRKTDLGYLCIVNATHSGLIFKDQTVKPLKIGQELKGYIKQIREDGKINLSLNKGATQAKDSLANIILEQLVKNNGFLPLNDKSKPQEIYHQFSVSKAIFKRTLGKLYKERKIIIRADGIYLS